MQSSSPLAKMVLIALFIALVTVGTMLVQIPTPGTQGYINFGDTLIFLAGALLGPLPGAAAGGLGSALADLLSGYAHYAPWTLLVKGLEGLVIGLLLGRGSGTARPGLGVLLSMASAGLLMVAGYCLVEIYLYGWVAAWAGVPGNLIQAGGSLILASVLLGPVGKALEGFRRR
ncbi:MAG: ECF transporter S component [Bacillota bacterium]|jgi:uncharacterized membrane protein